jgi:hypothetical protein
MGSREKKWTLLMSLQTLKMTCLVVEYCSFDDCYDSFKCGNSLSITGKIVTMAKKNNWKLKTCFFRKKRDDREACVSLICDNSELEPMYHGQPSGVLRL